MNMTENLLFGYNFQNCSFIPLLFIQICFVEQPRTVERVWPTRRRWSLIIQNTHNIHMQIAELHIQTNLPIGVKSVAIFISLASVQIKTWKTQKQYEFWRKKKMKKFRNLASSSRVQITWKTTTVNKKKLYAPTVNQMFAEQQQKSPKNIYYYETMRGTGIGGSERELCWLSEWHIPNNIDFMARNHESNWLELFECVKTFSVKREKETKKVNYYVSMRSKKCFA